MTNQLYNVGFIFLLKAVLTHGFHLSLYTKSGETKYKASVITKINDSRLNRHQPLQLRGWRANCGIQIVIDYYACVEYLVEYTSKSERMSSVVKTAFTSVVSKLTDDSDVHNTFQK